MITGIGCDILHLPRISSLIKRRGSQRLACKILSAYELKQFKALEVKERDRYLALRWVVKEATYKAFYPNHRLVWSDITILKQGTFALHGK